MFGEIDRLKNTVSEDSKRIKSLSNTIQKINNLINKNNFLKALNLAEEKLKPLLIKEYPDLVPDMENLISKLNNNLRTLKLNFDKDFATSCQTQGFLPLSGDSRKGFRVKGIIQVIIEFDKSAAVIKTYSKKRRINSLKVDDIIKEIRKTDARLFQRSLDLTKFFHELYEAYKRVSKGRLNEEVPLRDVQTQLWINRQPEMFWKSFAMDKLKDYPTDEFSVDISKLINSRPGNIEDLDFVLSEGAGGIVVYDNRGNFKSFKFIAFKKRGLS